ncbi:hypothetical protein BASA62_002345 [Batrachochytrium salamandrivorans]|nr:hypothetical protein BASA62_002345 [Batrachochytrium salamandrivorans]
MVVLVLPGDIVMPSNGMAEASGPLRLGPGLAQEHANVVATKAGIVGEASGNRLWLNASQKRYIPALGEPVLATVVSRYMENYRVDIGSPHPASLPVLAFEGATKRNKPNLDVGVLVYARVSLANKDMEPEIECTNPSTGKADGYGELKGGFMVKCSLGMCRSWDIKSVSLETAVGMNGRVWINAETPRQIIMIANLIRAADGAAPSKIPVMLKVFRKQMEATDVE